MTNWFTNRFSANVIRSFSSAEQGCRCTLGWSGNELPLVSNQSIVQAAGSPCHTLFYLLALANRNDWSTLSACLCVLAAVSVLYMCLSENVGVTLSKKGIPGDMWPFLDQVISSRVLQLPVSCGNGRICSVLHHKNPSCTICYHHCHHWTQWLLIFLRLLIQEQ